MCPQRTASLFILSSSRRLQPDAYYPNGRIARGFGIDPQREGGFEAKAAEYSNGGTTAAPIKVD
jgi:hypothetical protein